MRMTTIGLLTLIVCGWIPGTFAEAQSPEICAPVEQLDKYRYLRQLTLDLYGRIPTVEEYERLHAMDDVSEEIIDEMIGSPEFYAQLRRYHRNLLWSNLGEDDLVGQTIQEQGDEAFRVWLNRGKKSVVLGIGRTGHRKVLPHHDPAPVTQIEELVILVHVAAPAAHHIAVAVG